MCLYLAREGDDVNDCRGYKRNYVTLVYFSISLLSGLPSNDNTFHRDSTRHIFLANLLRAKLYFPLDEVYLLDNVRSRNGRDVEVALVPLEEIS